MRRRPTAYDGTRLMAQIIVVDDDPIMREVIRLVLEAAGHTVLRCENGRKALEVATHEHIDLMITDLLMPEMDGLETLRAVRQVRPALPILVISGGQRGNPGDFLGLARVFGATETLAKPFRPETMLDLVARMLDPSAAPSEG